MGDQPTGGFSVRVPLDALSGLETLPESWASFASRNPGFDLLHLWQRTGARSVLLVHSDGRLAYHSKRTTL